MKTSCFCARISSTRIGISCVSFFVVVSVMSMFATWCYLLCSVEFEVFAFSFRLEVRSGCSSSSGFLCLAMVESRGIVFAASCLIPVRWMTSKANSNNWRRKQTSRPLESERISMNLGALWSVTILKRWPSTNSPMSCTDQAVVEHLRCVILNRCSVLVRARN